MFTLPNDDILKQAIDANNVPELKAIIAKCGWNHKEAWHGGYVPFVYAHKKKHFRSALGILEAGAAVRFPEKHQLQNLFHVLASSNTAWNGTVSKIFEKLVERCPELISEFNICGETPLHMAIRQGHELLAYDLIQNDAAVNMVSTSGETPLYLATRYCNTEILNSLFEVEIDTDQETKHGHPFHVAVCTGNKEVVEVFQENNVDLDVKNSKGDTALHILCQIPDPSYECTQIIEYLLEEDVDRNIENNEKKTPLYYAVKNNDLVLVRTLIKKNLKIDCEGNQEAFTESIKLYLKPKEDTDRDPEDEEEPIMAVLLDHGFKFRIMDTINEPLLVSLMTTEAYWGDKFTDLLDLGASVNTRVTPTEDHPISTTLLQLAIESRVMCNMKLLLKRGADTNVKGKHDCSCLVLAINKFDFRVVKELIDHGANIDENLKPGVNILHYAANEGKNDVVKYLLDQGMGVDGMTTDNFKPLHFAAFTGNWHVVTTLLQHRAKVNCTPTKMSSPLHLAAQSYLKTLTTLIDFGADMNAQDEFGRTPLHVAVGKGVYTVVVALLLRDVDLEIRDNQGRTAYDVAKIYAENYCNREKNVNVYSEETKQLNQKLYIGVPDTFRPCYEQPYMKQKDESRDDFRDFKAKEDSTCIILRVFQRFLKFKEFRQKVLKTKSSSLEGSLKNFQQDSLKYKLMKEALHMRKTAITGDVMFVDLLSKGPEKIGDFLLGKKIEGKSMAPYKRFGFYSLLQNKIKIIREQNVPTDAMLEFNRSLKVKLPIEMLMKITKDFSRPDFVSILRATGFDEPDGREEESEEFRDGEKFKSPDDYFDHPDYHDYDEEEEEDYDYDY